MKAAEFKEMYERARQKKRSKYGNKRVTVGDTTYDSDKEAKHCEQLKLLQRAGKIHGLELQRRYPLKVNGLLITTYVCDAAFQDEKGRLHVQDVKGGKGGKDKGTRTREYIIKVKLMKAIYGIDVEEV